MSELSKKYQEIISELDNGISNKDELVFVKGKISEISIIFIDLIERMSGVVEEKISDIECSQQLMEKKLGNIESMLNSIQKDIYDEDEDTEIVCPYCNNNFYAKIDDEIKTEIECPECHNIIELDIDTDDMEEDFYGINNCIGHCHGCGGCTRNNDEEDE